MSYKEFKELKKELMKDPEFKSSYDEIDEQFKLAKMIISKRKEKGLTQKELAEKLNTSQSAISRLESGEYNPSFDFLNKVAQALESKLEVVIY